MGKGVSLMAVVKSNAYGHGAALVARVVERSGEVDWLGVASLAEAEQLRQQDITLPIFVLSYFRPFVPERLQWALSHKISFMVYEAEQLDLLEQAAKHAGKRAHVHVKLETGMARLGLMPEAAQSFIERIIHSPYLKLEGLASHLATAESADQAFLNKQVAAYEEFVKAQSGKLPTDLMLHLACSAAISTAPQTHFSQVRLGLALYGLWPSDENRLEATKLHPDFSLSPTLTWKTQVIEVQQLPANTPVGYDRTYVTKKLTTMAVLPVGYWDGYDRKLSNSGHVLVRGTRVPIIGRICMNIAMVDVTSVLDVAVGDEVVLLGTQGQASITADELAQTIGTINYEVVTRINPELPRLLV
jgi:alanine racemase